MVNIYQYTNGLQIKAKVSITYNLLGLNHAVSSLFLQTEEKHGLSFKLREVMVKIYQYLPYLNNSRLFATRKD